MTEQALKEHPWAAGGWGGHVWRAWNGAATVHQPTSGPQIKDTDEFQNATGGELLVATCLGLPEGLEESNHSLRATRKERSAGSGCGCSGGNGGTPADHVDSRWILARPPICSSAIFKRDVNGGHEMHPTIRATGIESPCARRSGIRILSGANDPANRNGIVNRR